MLNAVFPIQIPDEYENAVRMDGLLDRIRQALQNSGNAEHVGNVLTKALDQLLLLLLRLREDAVQRPGSLLLKA